MKSLVTGATECVGTAVVRALVRTGSEVRVLARPDSDLRNADGFSVERVAGDLRDPASLRTTALAGCRHRSHVVAHYALWIRIAATG
ncbi:MAG: NAD-dependent epimerase/dehydratase family protein [Nitrospira sp.]